MAARDKVARLEKAIEAMGDSTGAEVEILKTAEKRAQAASREAPPAVQVQECESFIARARHRITKLDEERVAEVAELEKAETRLARLKLQTGPVPPPPFGGSPEEQRLQQMVVELQAKLSSVDHQQLARDTPMRDAEPSKKRLREDYIPASVEDLVQWLSDRQKDLQEAMLSGRIQDVTRLAKLVADGGAQLTWTAEDCASMSVAK